MFNENLKRARSKKKLTQSKLASLLSVSQQTVASWETNKSSPDPETIVRLAGILEVSAEYLLGLTKNPTPEQRETIDLKNFLASHGVNDKKNIEAIEQIIKMTAKAERDAKFGADTDSALKFA